MKKSESKYVLVVGCGRLGANIASQLSRQGHSVVVIDSNEAKFSSLAVEFGGFRLEGDATEVAVLRQAKADRADSLIAVTADDNVNLTVAQMGRHVFGIAEVFARVSNPERAAMSEELGVEAVCPLTLASEDLLHRVLTAGEEGNQT